MAAAPHPGKQSSLMVIHNKGILELELDFPSWLKGTVKWEKTDESLIYSFKGIHCQTLCHFIFR
jgi:hypothetical protein